MAEVKVGEWIGDDTELNNIDRLRQIKDDLTKLQASPGKKYLDKFLRHQYNLLMAGIAAAPLARLDDALAQEYQKGRAFENLNFEFIVENLIAAFKEQIEDLQLQSSYEEREE